MTNLCNIDGRIRPEAAALIPVLDRGFLFGDSIYEVVRTHRGRLLSLGRHLERLSKSAQSLRIDIPIDDAKLEARIVETVHAAGNPESYVRIIVTRGTALAPDIDPDLTIAAPTVILLVRPLPEKPPDLMTRGLSAWLVTTRRNPRSALDPAIKSGNYLNNILGLMEARKHGADTALFLNPSGYLTEAPTANVWLVEDSGVATPELAAGILPGITRAHLIELGTEEGFEISERQLEEADLRRAQEVFLTSTTRDIAPITVLDGEPIGDGKPGKVTLVLAARYQKYCDRLVGL